MKTSFTLFVQIGGGLTVRQASGFFLFSFNPSRDRAMVMVSDFLFLCFESLNKKIKELHGFSLLLEDWGDKEVDTVFGQMKSLLFLTPQQNKIWSGTRIVGHPDFAFQKSLNGEDLIEIFGPVPDPLNQTEVFRQRLGLTGWVDGFSRNLQGLIEDSRWGKVLRIAVTEPEDKIPFLLEALRFEGELRVPILGSLKGSRDPWAQLGSLLISEVTEKIEELLESEDLKIWIKHPHWRTLAASLGSGSITGDHMALDFPPVLELWVKAYFAWLKGKGQPQLLVLVQPEAFDTRASKILEQALSTALKLRLGSVVFLEDETKSKPFLTQWPGVTWSLPSLSAQRVERECQKIGLDSTISWDAVVRAGEGRGMPVIHRLSLDSQEVDSVDPSWALLMNMETSHRKIYYICLLGKDIMTPEWVVEFFSFLGEDEGVVEDKSKKLMDLGFWMVESRSQVLRPDFLVSLEELLSEEAAFLKNRLGLFLYEKYLEDNRLTPDVILPLLLSTGVWDKALQMIKTYTTQKINRGQSDFLGRFRFLSRLTELGTPEPWKNRFQIFAAALKLRLALSFYARPLGPKELAAFQKNFPSVGSDEDSGEWLLQLGRFHIMSGNTNDGFQWMKKAFILAQAQGDIDLELRSGNEIGYALIHRRRIDEATEYFEMSARHSLKVHQGFVRILSTNGLILSKFLWGNFSSSLDLAFSFEAEALGSGMISSLVFLFFLRGRSQFVLGDYSSSVDSFRAGKAIAQEYQMSEAYQMLAGWEARGQVYWGEVQKALNLLATLESSNERVLFKAEAFFFQKKWDKAYQCLEAAKLDSGIVPLSGEHFSWKCGFGLVEDRVQALDGKLSILDILISGFRGYLRGLLGNPQEGILELHPWTSRKGLFEGNPHSHLFHFWQYSLMSKEDKSLEAQRITILGRGLRDLQTRASRIGDRNKRNDYLQIPYWNRLYMDESRKKKLV